MRPHHDICAHRCALNLTHAMRQRRQASTYGVLSRTGFTLVELLVVIAVIAILVGMLVPAVQSVRESARLSTCQNNLRQQCIGLLNYESAHKRFPIGSEPLTQLSWGASILPHLEQATRHEEIDFSKPWSESPNLQIVDDSLAVFVCPSSFKNFSGKTDYSGISGSLRFSGGSRNGVLLFGLELEERGFPISQITDGLSNTIMVGECSRLPLESGAYWISGHNCITHEDGGVSDPETSDTEISSEHYQGANVGFCSGTVEFISSQVDVEIVSALCTRAGAETEIDF